MRTVAEIKYELLYHAARLSLNCDLDITKICALFDELMQHGVYFDALLEIAWGEFESMVHAEFCLLFKRLLSIMGIPIFNNAEKAKQHIIYYHLNRIVNKKYDVNTETCELYASFPQGSCEFEYYGPAKILCEKYYKHANAFDAEWRTAEQQKLIDEALLHEAQIAFKQYQNYDAKDNG